MNKWEMDPYSNKIATWSTNVDEEIGFWQQYTYEFGKGNYSILHRCSICGFHPCDLNLGQYKFCPSCGRRMSAEPAPPIKIQVKPDERTWYPPGCEAERRTIE